MFNIGASPFAGSLDAEAEARWRLVETAWNLKIPPKLLEVRSDPSTKHLFVEASEFRRIPLVRARDALNGYQKGRCFYCEQKITIISGSRSTADIDHFFPKCLEQAPEFANINLDGVWNLVISCQRCNRGEGGKFEKIPTVRFLDKLHGRNCYLISSHHPLREALIKQTGNTDKARAKFLQSIDQESINLIPGRWQPTADQLDQPET